ncbi:MAG: hypothetical protein MUC97_13915 [Bernardetiaceae bacterium]|nr:hypothetical protein [Bernardetiaceae bacterium]
MLTPVVANIVLFHLAHDLPGNGIWLVTLALFGLVSYQQKKSFQALFNLQ